MRNHRRCGRKHKVYLPADQIDHRRAAALVRYMLIAHHCQALEQLAHKVSGGAGARRGVVQLTRPRARKRNQLLDVFYRQRRMRYQYAGLCGHQHHRGEIAQRIERQPGIQRLIGGKNAVVTEKPGETVDSAIAISLIGLRCWGRVRAYRFAYLTI